MELAEEILGVSAAKTELSQRLRKLQKGELERVVIVRQNSPVAVILSVEEYERMMRLVDDAELVDDVKALVDALNRDDGTRTNLDEIKARLGLD